MDVAAAGEELDRHLGHLRILGLASSSEVGGRVSREAFKAVPLN